MEIWTKLRTATKCNLYISRVDDVILHHVVFVDRATQADPKDIEALYIYADLCKEQGDNRRAAESLKKIAHLVTHTY